MLCSLFASLERFRGESTNGRWWSRIVMRDVRYSLLKVMRVYEIDRFPLKDNSFPIRN